MLKKILFPFALIFTAGCCDSPQPLDTPPKKSYILIEPHRPTHWSQEQWDILNNYLKRIDELEKRVKELENVGPK